jgi:hypothetical protein
MVDGDVRWLTGYLRDLMNVMEIPVMSAVLRVARANGSGGCNCFATAEGRLCGRFEARTHPAAGVVPTGEGQSSVVGELIGMYPLRGPAVADAYDIFNENDLQYQNAAGTDRTRKNRGFRDPAA